jgi:hypothetical protein
MSECLRLVLSDAVAPRTRPPGYPADSRREVGRLRHLRARAALAGGLFVVALTLAAWAAAVPPSLLSVSVQNRHPGANFSAPRAEFGTIYFSSKPDRSTDGSFLSENVKLVEVLTDSELQSGRWVSETQLDPGTYWALIRVSPDFSACWNVDAGAYDPACADGFSNVATLVVPKPRVRYSSRATVFRFIRRALLELRAAPLGEKKAVPRLLLASARVAVSPRDTRWVFMERGCE